METEKKDNMNVYMIFINLKLNDVMVKAFIDTGAQFSIMSLKCAKKCNLFNQIDNSRPGLAKGIGVQLIIGEINEVELKIGDEILKTNCFVNEEQPMDFIFGLNLLKKYNCQIDLKNNVLRLGNSDTYAKFLEHDELPQYFQTVGLSSAEQLRDEKIIKRELKKRGIKYNLQKPVKNPIKTTKSTNNNKKINNPNFGKKASSKSGNLAFPICNRKSLFDNTDAKIKEIVGYGFDRNDVIQELNNCNGNVRKTIQSLINHLIVISKRNDEEMNENVQRLVKFGFKRDEIIKKLNEFQGDINKSIEALVDEGFKRAKVSKEKENPIKI